jgi:hypothetical protein
MNKNATIPIVNNHAQQSKYPTPEDVQAFDERIKNHPVLKAQEYVSKYNRAPNDDMLSIILSEIVLEIPVLQKQRPNTKTVFFGILNELDDKWRCFCRHCGNEKAYKRAFEQTIRMQASQIYFEWVRYRKLTVRRK